MDKIKVSNFRKVKDTWDIDLAPITFFTGTNNSGKSSILKALMVISDYTNSNNHLNISFNGKNYPKHKIDCYTNASNWENNKNKEINFHINHEGFSIEISFSPSIDEFSSKKYTKGQLSYIKVKRDEDDATFKLERKAGNEYQMIVNSLLLEKSELSNDDTILTELEQLQSFLEQNNEIDILNKEKLIQLEKEKEEKEKNYNATFNAFKNKISSKKAENNHINVNKSEDIHNTLNQTIEDLVAITPKLEYNKKKLENKVTANNKDISSLNEKLELLKEKKKLFSSNNSQIDPAKLKRFIRRNNTGIDECNREIVELKNQNEILQSINLDTFVTDLTKISLLWRNRPTSSSLFEAFLLPKIFQVLLKLNKSILEINNSLANSDIKDIDFIKSIKTNTSKLKNILSSSSTFDKDDDLKSLEKQLINLIDQHENTIINLNKSIIKLKNEIIQNQTKSKELVKRIKQLKTKSIVKEDGLIFNPTFNIDDLHLTEPSLDKIIRKVLEKYFTEVNTSDKKVMLNLKEEISKLIYFGDQMVDVLTFSVDHLSPHRNSQTRLYVNDVTSSDIYELINLHSQYPIDKRSQAGKFIKKWMQEFDIGDDYKIRSIEGMASIIEIEENNKWINLVDKGFGAGQIFAILLKIAQNISKRKYLEGKNKLINQTQLILIEEPEANLHPALQSKLADLFYNAYSNYGIRFIIETHSEYVIRRSQLIGLENNYFSNEKQNPFKVFYFEKENGPYEMIYTSEGNFERDFGKGFYNEAAKLTMNRIKAARNLKKNV